MFIFNSYEYIDFSQFSCVAQIFMIKSNEITLSNLIFARLPRVTLSQQGHPVQQRFGRS